MSPFRHCGRGQKIHSVNKLFERAKIDFFVMAGTAGMDPCA
jgi:hypothetical protein